MLLILLLFFLNVNDFSKYHFKNRTASRIVLHRDISFMHTYDFTDKCQSESYPSKRSASGFIHAEKRIKYSRFQFFGNAVSRILNL